MNYKRYSSLTILFLAILFFLSGVAGGSIAGYVVAKGQVADPQLIIAQPASSDILFDWETAIAVNSFATFPDQPAPTIRDAHYSPVEAINLVLPAVVTVIGRDDRSFGSGSGFFVSPEGYVVTNNHVVKKADKLAIIYAHGGFALAELVGTAAEFDLAVLKVDGLVPAMVEWGDSSAFPLGTEVIVIGSALGRYQNTVTAGILSGFNRELGSLRGLLQTDAAINQGSSGGPLINLDGEVIGINTLMVRGRFFEAEGLGFAIPSNVARVVVQQLIETGGMRTPYLGAQYQGLHKGAVLKDVDDDTPANEAGLQAGDVIMALNGQPVDERHPFVSLLIAHTPGETVTLDVQRDGEMFQANLTFGERALVAHQQD